MSNFPVPTVSLVENRPCTTSLAIAEHFGKNHQHVMRDIRELIADCPGDFNASNFGLVDYTDAKGEKRPMYHVFFDGFILLVMGYTGKKALQMKLAYIAAFNAMREKLEGRGYISSDSPILPIDQNIIQTLVAAIADRYPEAERKSVYMQVWMRFRNHFRIGSYKQLPQSKMAEAVTWLANLKVNAPKPAKLTSGKQNEPVAIDPEMSRLLQETLTALTDMQKQADYRIGIIEGYLQNSVMHHCSEEEKQRMFYTLKHIRHMAADGLYMAQNALAVAWHLGRGVSFI